MLSQAYKYQKQQTKAQKNTDKFLEKINKNTSNVVIGLQILEVVDKGTEKHRQIFRKN